MNKFDITKGINCANCPVVQDLQSDIQQHIKWNEAHTKARVELTEEIKRLREYLDSANECNTV